MTNREQDDPFKDEILNQLGSGPGAPPQSGTMPVGQPMPMPQITDQMPAPAMDMSPTKGGGGVADRKALGGYAGVGKMLGFNTAMDYGDDKAANSAKNTFGRIASRYEAKPSSMKAIAADPDFQRHFAGAYFDEKDRLHLPPGMVSDFESGTDISGAEGIDVLGSSDPTNDTAAGWTWQDLKNDGGGGGAPMGDGGGMDLASALQGLGGGEGGDVLAQIMAELQKAQNGEEPAAFQQALLDELGGGAPAL